MAFNYDGLKKVTSAGIVDSTLVTNDIANSTLTSAAFAPNSVTTDKLDNSTVVTDNIPDGDITSAKLATSAVNLAGSKVTGTLPISKGGFNRTTVGSARKSVRARSSAFQYEDAGLISVQVFTSNGTWTKPSGITRIRVQVVGGGGGGTGHGEAGGAGGYSEEYIDVTSISSVAVTIGGGGGGVNYHNVAGNGATTSFGPYLSASGGEGARRVGGHTGGRPGVGSGGNLNIYGGGGSGHTLHGGGLGGFSYFGGSSIGVHDSSPQVSNQEGQATPGSGGTGGPRALRRGGTGRGGMVIVWMYR